MNKENEIILSEKDFQEILEKVVDSESSTATEEREVPMLRDICCAIYKWESSSLDKKIFITDTEVITASDKWESRIDEEVELTDNLSDYKDKRNKHFVNITMVDSDYIQIVYFVTHIRRYRVFRLNVSALDMTVLPTLSELFKHSEYSIQLLNSVHKYFKRDVSTSLSIYAHTVVQKYVFNRIESPWYNQLLSPSNKDDPLLAFGSSWPVLGS